MGQKDSCQRWLFPSAVRTGIGRIPWCEIYIPFCQWNSCVGYRPPGVANHRRSDLNAFQFRGHDHALWRNNIKPVFVDIEHRHCNLETDKVESAIRKNGRCPYLPLFTRLSFARSVWPRRERVGRDMISLALFLDSSEQ